MSTPPDRFGDQTPFCEPAWYQGQFSPYYHDGHRQFRAKCRTFLEERILPHVNEWIQTGYPKEIHKDLYDAGISGILYPPEYGGTRPADFDAFYELILNDELARAGGGNVLGQLSINSMALPPLIAGGHPDLKKLVVEPVVRGYKNICLAISEPGAGSDVGNIQTSARKEGDYYIVNGAKKWITGGLFADYFTMAVRTGKPGMGGISLLLVDRNSPGIDIRKMQTQQDNAHNTTFITLEDVKVPVKNLIGKENMGFMLIVRNFNHERFVISCSFTRLARICYEQAFKYALTRKTFGKRLVDHQIIRFKLAEMVRQIETLQDSIERVAYQISKGIPDSQLGGACALIKVSTSKTLEFCAREASQIFGGAAVVKEGKGMIVERLYREVRSVAIPGGSEEILMDLAIRQAIAQATRNKDESPNPKL
jgi:alkylation response protein AidB-like acyl-CoA dehydrogenase